MNMLSLFFTEKAHALGGIPAPSNTSLAGNDTINNFLTGTGGIIDTVFGVFLLIAGVLAVFYLVWAGIQYITAGGSPDKAKAARQGIINAIIGIVVIVAAFFIVRFAVSIGNTVSG